MNKFIRFNSLKEITNPGFDGHSYSLILDTGEIRDGNFTPSASHKVRIVTSGTLQAVWEQDDQQLIESSATAAWPLIVNLLSKGELKNNSEVLLNTYTAPETAPTSPKIVEGSIFPLVEDRPVSENKTPRTFLDEHISKVRDEINTFSRDLLGEALLKLLQERALIDIYKSVNTPEEFSSRVQSLTGLCIAINESAISKELGAENLPKQPGSINLLEKLLEKYSDAEKASNVCKVLKGINELRKGYPAHGDFTDSLLAAHDYFDIDYPIRNHLDAWERILNAYCDAMKNLREILKTESKKRRESNR